MIFAGHLPTKHFNQAEWQAMPVFMETDGSLPRVDGYHRSVARNDRPIVFWWKWTESGNLETYAVRPIVRVPMGRA